MEQLQNQLMETGITIGCMFIALVGGYAVLYLQKAKDKVNAEISKIKDEKAKKLFENAVNAVNDITFDAVVNAQNTVVKELKESAKDGIVNREDLINIGVKVKENVVNQLKPDIKESLSYGVNSVEAYISNKIETQLAIIKGQLQ